MNQNTLVTINDAESDIYLVQFEGLYLIDTSTTAILSTSSTIDSKIDGGDDGKGSHKETLLIIIIVFIVAMILLATGFICYYWRKMGSDLDRPSSMFDFNFGSNSTTNDANSTRGKGKKRHKWHQQKNKINGLMVPNNSNNRMLSIQSQSSMDLDESMDGIMSNASNERSKSGQNSQNNGVEESSTRFKETDTRGNFEQNVGDHALGTEMVLSDIVNEMDDETPQ